MFHYEVMSCFFSLLCEVEAFAVGKDSTFKSFNDTHMFTPAEESWLLYHAIQEIPYNEATRQ